MSTWLGSATFSGIPFPVRFRLGQSTGEIWRMEMKQQAALLKLTRLADLRTRRFGVKQQLSLQILALPLGPFLVTLSLRRDVCSPPG